AGPAAPPRRTAATPRTPPAGRATSPGSTPPSGSIDPSNNDAVRIAPKPLGGSETRGGRRVGAVEDTSTGTGPAPADTSSRDTAIPRRPRDTSPRRTAGPVPAPPSPAPPSRPAPRCD